jgi:hypothetical protein
MTQNTTDEVPYDLAELIVKSTAAWRDLILKGTNDAELAAEFMRSIPRKRKYDAGNAGLLATLLAAIRMHEQGLFTPPKTPPTAH